MFSIIGRISLKTTNFGVPLMLTTIFMETRYELPIKQDQCFLFALLQLGALKFVTYKCEPTFRLYGMEPQEIKWERNIFYTLKKIYQSLTNNRIAYLCISTWTSIAFINNYIIRYNVEYYEFNMRLVRECCGAHKSLKSSITQEIITTASNILLFQREKRFIFLWVLK